MSESNIVITIHISLMTNNLQKMYFNVPAFLTRGRTEEGDHSVTSSMQEWPLIANLRNRDR